MATKSGIKAGRAFVVIEAMDKTSFVLRRISAKMKGFANEVTSMGRTMMTKGLAGLTPAALSVKTFATFDDSMRKVEARSAGTAQQMEDLRHQAKELGRTTSFTASQVGELQAKLAQKGFDRKQIKDMTGDVMALARAAGEGSEEDTVLAADLVSGTIRAFQMEAKDAGRIADIFSTAVNNSNFNLEGLMDGMAKAGPLAADFGMTVEETAATLASMTNLNITSSEAGTALQSFLARMSKAEFTGNFNRGLEELTGQTVEFRDEMGNLRKPLEIFAEIGQKTRSLGTAERGDLMSILFGVRQFGKATGGARGAIDAMELLTKLQNESQGEAQRTAQAMDAGLGGGFRKLWSAVEGVAIAIGESLAPSLNKLLSLSTDWLGVATKWIKENQGIIMVATAIAGAFLLAGLSLVILGGIISVVSFALGTLATILATIKALFLGLGTIIASPFFIIGAAIAGAIALLWVLSDSFREVFGGIGSWLRDVFGGFLDTFQTAWTGILSAIGQNDFGAAWEIMVQGAELVWLQFMDTLATAWHNVGKFFVEAWHGTVMAIKELWWNLVGVVMKSFVKVAEQGGVLASLVDATMGTNMATAIQRGLAGGVDPDALRESIDRGVQDRIQQSQTDAAEALDAFSKGNIEAERTRQDEINRRKEALEALVREVEERDRISDSLEEQGDLARGSRPDVGDLGAAGGASAMAPTISQGLEKGSVQAAQKAWENATRAEEAAGRELDEERNRRLESMDIHMAELVDRLNIA